MQKKYNSILIFIFIFSVAFCQEKSKKPTPEKKPLSERIYFGGNLGLQFGDVTFIDASPLVGYKVTDNFSVGAGITYIYIKYRNYNSYTTTIYGGRVFSRYYFLENLFIHGEVEQLSGYWDPFLNRRTFVTSVLGGAGYRQRISDKVSMTFLILWNFNESIYSPYSNPIIRGGLTFGI